MGSNAFSWVSFTEFKWRAMRQCGLSELIVRPCNGGFREPTARQPDLVQPGLSGAHDSPFRSWRRLASNRIASWVPAEKWVEFNPLSCLYLEEVEVRAGPLEKCTDDVLTLGRLLV